MDPQTCTVILFNPANPFQIEDNEYDATFELLESTFRHVHRETHIDACLNYVKLLPSSLTLLLIELDEDMMSNRQIEMISQTVDKMPDSIPVVVCSNNQDSQFMLDCIQAGAADYLLRPLRPDVIKTLFLTLHRRLSTPLYQDHLLSSTTISTVVSLTTPTSPKAMPNLLQKESPVYIPDRMQDRIKSLYAKDQSFIKNMIDSYIPLNANVPSYKPLSNDHQQALRKRVSVWDFSPLDLSHEELIHCAVIIISQVFTLPHVPVFTTVQLYDFISELSSIYHNENPYHNFAHAVDVLQCIYYFLCQMGLIPLADGSPNLSHSKSYHILRPSDIFALFIAAIGHDTSHPGVNNAFLINTSAPLALLYNDHSVLESFHAMTLFQLLKKHRFDQILGGTNSVQYIEFRKLVITTILATDMALHSDYVTKIKEQKERLVDSNPSEWDEPRCLEERLLFCSGLIKCADISNVARPFSRAYEWAQILVEEFASQGDLERELGMPVLPMNDRNQIVLEDSQIGFIRFVALGLFESVSDYMQELSFPVDYIKQNLSIWEDRKRDHMPPYRDRRHNENTQSTTTTVVGSHYPKDDSSSSTEEEEDDDDYHTQVADAIGGKPDYNLPKMPAVAMTSLSHNSSPMYPMKENQELDHISDWHPREDSTGPVYCQCIIQ
ncbi:hypothetical protein EDC96DRAFT_498924 [Choanephora cucurbitarum]|nr:hypothetical protein EDC96DRAFT_498924 [Choanephora cucurbitarum]